MLNRLATQGPPLKPTRLIPYLAALLLVAWILGSLARSGTSGGSLLSNSTWLVYAIDLLPLAALGLMVAIGIYLAINWRLMSDVLGFGLANRRRVLRKRNRTLQLIVWITAWGLAIGVLLLKCGGLVCNSASSVSNTSSTVQNAITPGGTLPQLPLLGALLAVSSLIDTNFFIYTFFALVAVSSVIMVRAFAVSMKQGDPSEAEALAVVHEGQEAVQDAIRMLDDETQNPRTKILACYQRMIKAAQDLGAPVGPDRTARELEKGIRDMFLLKGNGIAMLTALFEEARYSLHDVSEEDSGQARDCLLDIQEELRTTARPASTDPNPTLDDVQRATVHGLPVKT
jgi:hypothetical protein